MSLKVELPLRTLFEHPTVAEMGEAIEKIKQSETESDLTSSSQTPSIRPVSREARRMKQTSAGFIPLTKPATSMTDQIGDKEHRDEPSQE